MRPWYWLWGISFVGPSKSIKKAKDRESIAKLVRAFILKADEGDLGRLLVEMVILQSVRSQTDANVVLKEAAEYYKVDTETIATKVKQEFAAKEKSRTTSMPRRSKRQNLQRNLPLPK